MTRKKSVYAQRYHFSHIIGDATVAFRDVLNPGARIDMVWSKRNRDFSPRILILKDYLIADFGVPVDVLRKRIPRHVMARLVALSMRYEPLSEWVRSAAAGAASAAMSNVLLEAARKSVSDLFRVPLEPTEGGVFKMQTGSRLTGDELKSVLKPKKKE